MDKHEIKINAEGFTILHSVNGFWTRCADCCGMKIETDLYEAYIHLPLFFRLCLVTRLWGISIRGSSKIFLSSQMRQNCLWGPSNIKLKGYQNPFLRGWRRWVVKLNIHLHLVPRLRINEALPSHHYIPFWRVGSQNFLQNRIIIKRKIDYSNKPGAWMWDANRSGRLNRFRSLISNWKPWNQISFNWNIRPQTSPQTTVWHCADSANIGQIARIWAPHSIGGFLGCDYNYNAFVFTKMWAIHLSSATENVSSCSSN